MMQKIHIGVICNRYSDVKKIIDRNINNAEKDIYGNIKLEQEHFIFHHIKPFTSFKGKRLNQVYINREIAKSAWFNITIRPMLMGDAYEISE